MLGTFTFTKPPFSSGKEFTDASSCFASATSPTKNNMEKDFFRVLDSLSYGFPTYEQIEQTYVKCCSDFDAVRKLVRDELNAASDIMDMSSHGLLDHNRRDTKKSLDPIGAGRLNKSRTPAPADTNEPTAVIYDTAKSAVPKQMSSFFIELTSPSKRTNPPPPLGFSERSPLFDSPPCVFDSYWKNTCYFQHSTVECGSDESWYCEPDNFPDRTCLSSLSMGDTSSNSSMDTTHLEDYIFSPPPSADNVPNCNDLSAEWNELSDDISPLLLEKQFKAEEETHIVLLAPRPVNGVLANTVHELETYIRRSASPFPNESTHFNPPQRLSRKQKKQLAARRRAALAELNAIGAPLMSNVPLPSLTPVKSENNPDEVTPPKAFHQHPIANSFLSPTGEEYPSNWLLPFSSRRRSLLNMLNGTLPEISSV